LPPAVNAAAVLVQLTSSKQKKKKNYRARERERESFVRSIESDNKHMAGEKVLTRALSVKSFKKKDGGSSLTGA